MVQAKNDAKAILDHVDGKDQFLEVMQERGQTEDGAERLWHYLQRAIDEHGEGKSQGFFTRLGKGAWEALTGSDANSKSEKSETVKQFMGEPVDEIAGAIGGILDRKFEEAEGEIADELADNHPDEVAREAAGIAGDTFGDMREAIMARVTEQLNESEAELSMSDDDTPDDPPEWAKSIQETTEENSKAIKELREELKESNDDPWEDAPEWAKSLKESTESNAESIEELANASGKSQQLDGGEEESDSQSKADILGIPGGDD
jgi:hypothetical protein